jgi:hypothetical protein
MLEPINMSDSMGGTTKPMNRAVTIADQGNSKHPSEHVRDLDHAEKNEMFSAWWQSWSRRRQEQVAQLQDQQLR